MLRCQCSHASTGDNRISHGAAGRVTNVGTVSIPSCPSAARYLRLLLLPALLASAFLALGMPLTVRAAVVTANVFADPTPGPCATTGTGSCSLREAVIFANAHPVSTINLLAGTYVLTI